jgi:hypothetical protein
MTPIDRHANSCRTHRRVVSNSHYPNNSVSYGKSVTGARMYQHDIQTSDLI